VVAAGTSWLLVVINLIRGSTCVPGASFGSVDFTSVSPPQPKRAKRTTDATVFFMFKSFQVNRVILIAHLLRHTYKQKL